MSVDKIQKVLDRKKEVCRSCFFEWMKKQFDIGGIADMNGMNWVWE